MRRSVTPRRDERRLPQGNRRCHCIDVHCTIFDHPFLHQRLDGAVHHQARAVGLLVEPPFFGLFDELLTNRLFEPAVRK